ncbi:MAG TPA: amidohydrolase [Tepidimicrobium sp.]|nr:amidohydrolase [Tepidimicrobium sp.]
MFRKKALGYLNKKREELVRISKEIWDEPELAYDEYFASKIISEYLKSEGFEVELGYADIPTAIRASYGSGGPVVGLLGEYDALPRLSQKVGTSQVPIKEGGPGHGCGHNLLGVSKLAAAVAIKEGLQQEGLDGTIVFYGCPAEEVLTGKPLMARAGAFKELDMALAWHPSNHNMARYGSNTAVNSAKFHFKGITAHAAADPHNGRSALSAVELMNVGANYLREHVTNDVRIHYVITDGGGEAPNVVPESATVFYYVRAFTRKAVVDVYDRLVKIAKGAAMMTETELDIEFLGGCYNYLPNRTLVDLLDKVMRETDTPEWTEEEIEFAKELNSKTDNYEKVIQAGLAKEGQHLATEVLPQSDEPIYASTDVGDVSHIVPTGSFVTATQNIGAPGHSWQVVSCSGHSIGQKGMIYAAEVMVGVMDEILKDPTIIERAKEEFEDQMGGQEYICPIPDDLPIP